MVTRPLRGRWGRPSSAWKTPPPMRDPLLGRRGGAKLHRPVRGLWRARFTALKVHAAADDEDFASDEVGQRRAEEDHRARGFVGVPLRPSGLIAVSASITFGCTPT